MSDIVKITDSNFEEEVLQFSGPVLVDISTEWCAPCKMLDPILGELASQYNGKVKIGRVDADNSPQIAARYSVLSVPTLLFFKNSQLVDTQIGLISKQVLQSKLDAILQT